MVERTGPVAAMAGMLRPGMLRVCVLVAMSAGVALAAYSVKGAEDANDFRYSKSAGFANRAGVADADEVLSTARPFVFPRLRTEGYRDADAADKGTQSDRASEQTDRELLQSKPREVNHHPSMRHFWIYDAEAELVGDEDFDGYYHRFSILFDADVEYGTADVYAKLYLSFDGGPWNHFFTTDLFSIYGTAPDDDYEVVTSLLESYPPGQYDVLIELYEDGYDDIVVAYGPYEDPALSALPLEDEVRDGQVQGEESQASLSTGSGGGGGLGLWALGAVLALVRVRSGRDSLFFRGPYLLISEAADRAGSVSTLPDLQNSVN